jgi:hypothetical protein
MEKLSANSSVVGYMGYLRTVLRMGSLLEAINIGLTADAGKDDNDCGQPFVLKALPTPRKRSRCKMWLFCQRSVSQNVLGRCQEKHLVVADVMTRCLHKRLVSAVVVVTSTMSRTVVKATRLAPPIPIELVHCSQQERFNPCHCQAIEPSDG